MLGWVIGGYVRRGGGRPQKAFWTGTSWAKKPKVYNTQRQASAAVNRINITLVDSIAVYPVKLGAASNEWVIE